MVSDGRPQYEMKCDIAKAVDNETYTQQTGQLKFTHAVAHVGKK